MGPSSQQGQYDQHGQQVTEGQRDQRDQPVQGLNQALNHPRLILLAAVAKGNVIGVNNTLPWHLPEDLQRFKALTTGHVVAMGRKTFDSIVARLGKPLPNRHNVVISRKQASEVLNLPVLAGQALDQAVHVIHSANDLHALCTQGSKDIFIIGGAEIYQMTIGLADTLDITEVDLEVNGDAFFPEINLAHWRKTAGPWLVSQAEGLRYRFVTYQRIAAISK
jgi:dihydrofolate reductase